VENKDSCLLNKCGAEKKFFIMELCDDILVDTVVLANFKFFSPMFRSLKIFDRDRYPIKRNGWKDVSTFEARNSRPAQAFLIGSGTMQVLPIHRVNPSSRAAPFSHIHP